MCRRARSQKLRETERQVLSAALFHLSILNSSMIMSCSSGGNRGSISGATGKEENSEDVTDENMRDWCSEGAENCAA